LCYNIIKYESFQRKGGMHAMEEIRSRYGQYAALFGQEVDIVVNRPLGSYPQGGAAGKRRKRYPVNCGYITTDLSALFPAAKADGSGRSFDVDALPPRYVYILGVDEPLETFRGRIVAVVHRNVRTTPPADGAPAPQYSYDRLIVVPAGMEIYEPEIRHAIAFAERRGRYRLYCMYEKSCGAVVYTVHDGEPLYLLIRNRSGHIGFPKGHVEYGEDERATMMREIREETSLVVEPDLSFREEYHYVLWGVVHKRAVYSMAQFAWGHSVTTMENEIFGDWLVPYAEARKLLSYDNDRKILELAHNRITGSPA
ncbi:MAG: NUDIX domain-containing protein, partial [Clostridia bacterium]|nr:NUDIX domain-containing protein [Clostridia bacterium]